jgi:ADP-heptose:LPS heptosyltransferase
VLRNLDLFITSDTAVARLAGALGVPVWMRLSTTPDWRSMIHREDNP